MISKKLDLKLLGKDILQDILGQQEIKHHLKSALLCGRHIIVVGPPGIGKTTLAKSVAKLLPEIEVNDCGYNCLPSEPLCPTCRLGKKVKQIKISGIQRFVRLQGSPDLTAEDLIGDIDPIKAMKFGPLSLEAFTPGKIFKANNGVLFFDELNRCPEKLQNALLQVLEEKKATIGSYDVDLTADFVLIATMNPHDSSTEKLNDVLLDRFDLVYMGYPENLEIEKKIAISKGLDLGITFPEDLLHYCVAFIQELRQNENLEQKPSVRATLGLYERAQANAKLNGSNEVKFDDIKAVMESVIAHRIKLKPSVKYLQDPVKFVKDEFEKFLDKNPGFSSNSEKKGEVSG
ncbi:AAA domain-containing protein [Candidatus Woesearchaeota archaeon]|nr:AAA domain-containing protein [Candidatus Woesearchaeota archaeon]MBT5271849.1 AAA domain-containing protein [Candidatus Woesearchaeota archaeon]MBT6041687.1 AAA domain-containing protein [Candidatus Woesearchaeota archaeon]MBT6337337.1 AAA domain-containing protein [Candidatus Woesearchaeota archaeon]MBT7927585.1 AAA domain-containing protein [Candidatus Woesearchaeota archaeon]